MNSKLADMVLKDGSWNLDLFRIWVPEEIILSIINIPLPILKQELTDLCDASQHQGISQYKVRTHLYSKTLGIPKTQVGNSNGNFKDPKGVVLSCGWLSSSVYSIIRNAFDEA